VVSAALLLMVAAQAGPLIDRYGEGGTSVSPSGRWRLVAPPNRGDDPYARAMLVGPGVRRGIDYLRMLRVVWPQDRQHVILAHVALDGEVLTVHALAPRDRVPAQAIEQSLEREMMGRAPLLEAVDRQEIDFGTLRGILCVRVEQAGTAKGRKMGSFVSRTGRFRLDLVRGRAIPVKKCPM